MILNSTGHLRLLSFWFCCIGCGLLTGCEPASKPVDHIESSSTVEQEEQLEQASSEVAVRYGSLQEVQDYIKTQTGKVVVMDVWSTWCIPCVREFPKLVGLQQKFPENVVCISLNLNFEGIEGEKPQDSEKEVLQFLKENDAHLVNYISSQESETVYKELRLDSLPAVYVYDQQGGLSKVFENSGISSSEEEFTYEKDIIPLVQELTKPDSGS